MKGSTHWLLLCAPVLLSFSLACGSASSSGEDEPLPGEDLTDVTATLEQGLTWMDQAPLSSQTTFSRLGAAFGPSGDVMLENATVVNALNGVGGVVHKLSFLAGGYGNTGAFKLMITADSDAILAVSRMDSNAVTLTRVGDYQVELGFAGGPQDIELYVVHKLGDTSTATKPSGKLAEANTEIKPSVTIESNGASVTIDNLDSFGGVENLNGQRVLITSMRWTRFCRRGVLVGRFVRLDKGVEAGIIYGRWHRFDGTTGAIHGFWGQKKDGSHVFMAYYYATDGSMQGLLKGRYETFAGGHRLVGQWEKKDGSVEGWVTAKLVLPTETALRGGLFQGRWGRSDCPTEEGTVDDQLTNDFDTSDEADYFGQPQLFEDTETVDDDPDANDTLDQTDDTLKALLAGNSPFVVLRIGWGFLSYHPFFAPTIWGTENEPLTISVNRGGLKVLRLIRFDSAADQMLPRTDPQAVDVASVTGPHFDGIVLLWVLGTGQDAPTLTFTSNVHTETISLAAMASAPSAPHNLVIDVPGTRKNIFVSAMVVQRQKVGCDKGFVAGRWIHLPFADNKGLFIGRWIDKNGLNAGYVYGVWGDAKILGKVIGTDWTYKGNLKGTANSTEQTFAGDYIEYGTKTGSVTGMYRTPDETDYLGGFFEGNWVLDACN